jgi:peptide/nickel transport system substrate-binding protein
MMLARRLDFGNMARQYPAPARKWLTKSGEIEQMSVRRSLFAAATATMLALAMAPASAQTLRYANQGDLKSLDPYTLNESTTHAHLGHVFEGLVARDRDLKIIPALAESWETPEPTRWRFHFRKGV